MKAILIVPEYPSDLPPHGLGGMTTYFMNMALGYLKNGLGVRIFTSSLDSRLGDREVGPNGEVVHRVFRHRSRYSPGWMGRLRYELQKEFRLAVAVWRARRGVALVEVPDWQPPFLAPFLMPRARLYMKLHGPSDFIRIINGGTPGRLRDMLDIRERFWAKRVSILEAGSPVLVDHAKARWKLDREVPLTPDPFDISVAADWRLEDTPPLGIGGGHDTVHVVNVGRLEYRKGQHIVCQALAHLETTDQHWSLHFVGPDTHTGPGHSSYRAHCEALVPERYRDKVNWHGPVPLSDLGAVYNSADIVLISSLDGNYGYTTLHPLAAGACVITTLEPGQQRSQYVEHEVSGLLYESDDASTLARLLERAIEQPGFRSLLREGAAQRAASTLSPASHAGRILHMLGNSANTNDCR